MEKANVLVNIVNRYFAFFSDSRKLLIQKRTLIGPSSAHLDWSVIINVVFKEVVYVFDGPGWDTNGAVRLRLLI